VIVVLRSTSTTTTSIGTSAWTAVSVLGSRTTTFYIGVITATTAACSLGCGAIYN
jgi:uncharacterized membrane protein YczE